ncbi:MAG: amylo-alpha-1,6-glucosidase [Acidobacteriaceae bacterium]
MAQTATVQPLPSFPLNQNPDDKSASHSLVIRRHVETGKPFTVAGERGLVLGQQEGTFEAWVLPVKLLSNFRIRVEVEGYTVPIELNPAAAEIEVHPDHTTITYSHIAFTVRQVMFAPDSSPDGTGAVVMFQFDSVRPMDVTFSFTPDVRPMWPLHGDGVPSPEWVRRGDSGFYMLHLDMPSMAAAVAMPHTQPGILAPYQEKPQTHPLQLKLHYDPKLDRDSYFPLLMAVGTTPDTATTQALEAKIAQLSSSLTQLYQASAAHYAGRLQELTSIETPDPGFDADFRWAEVSIEQLRALAQPSGETGLVAGYYSSGDSARPGFGWFFGRDALYTLYAVDGYGDFRLSREVLEFLLKRQRADGKVMHEYSQTAAFLDWKALPYMYAAADATPLFLTAVLDYVRESGDVGFLRQNRAAFLKAWQFETSHDSDGDGIYDNSQGTGWVESWPTGLPHQEIYLALLDQQASHAMAQIAALLGDEATAAQATTRASNLTAKIEQEYARAAPGGATAYAFSRNADGSLDSTSTIYPVIAWWNGGAGLARADASFRRWASHSFSTDWGTRDVASDEKFYDPISYHQGSVWPLFTGWTSLAEYRDGRTLSAYAHLMQNADLTTAQDLGAVTELLSGDFFAPFGRSTSHQLWSSAMVLIPATRGLFGLDVDALNGIVTVAPHLPAQWDRAFVRHLHIGQSICDVSYERKGGNLAVKLTMVSGPAIHLQSSSSVSRSAPSRPTHSALPEGTLLFPLPPVEVSLDHGLPLPGSRTQQMKVLEQSQDGHSLHLTLEAPAGSVQRLMLRRNVPALRLHADGADLSGQTAEGQSGMKQQAAGSKTPTEPETVVVRFPPGSGYQEQVVTLRW